MHKGGQVYKFTDRSAIVLGLHRIILLEGIIKRKIYIVRKKI